MPSDLWKTLRLTALPFAYLLAVLPTSAAPITAMPTLAAQYSPHKLFLKNILPEDLLNKLGWTSTLAPDNGPSSSALPQGVNRIYAIAGDNSLLVFSTVDGFNLVKAMVKNLDLPSRKALIGVSFVTARTADVNALGSPFYYGPTAVQIVSGSDAVRLYGLTNKIKARRDARPVATTDNDHPASFPIAGGIPFLSIGPPIIPNASGATANQIFQNVDPNSRLTIWPHINSDQTVTLGVEPFLELGLLSRKDVHFTLAPLVLQTLPSGDTVAIRLDLIEDEDIGLQTLDATSARQDHQPMTLLIFITATITNATGDLPKTPSTPAPVGATAP